MFWAETLKTIHYIWRLYMNVKSRIITPPQQFNLTGGKSVLLGKAGLSLFRIENNAKDMKDSKEQMMIE